MEHNAQGRKGKPWLRRAAWRPGRDCRACPGPAEFLP